MTARIIGDAVVKTGSYTDGNGQPKNRYENIGKLMQGDDGGYFMILKTTFNPAGVPNPDNKDAVMVSIFAPNNQQQGGGQQGGGHQQQPPQQNAYAAAQQGVAPTQQQGGYHQQGQQPQQGGGQYGNQGFNQGR